MDSQVIGLSHTVSNETTVKAYYYFKLIIVSIKKVEKLSLSDHFNCLNK